MVGGLINSEFGRTPPKQRGMQTALPEADYSVFPEFFEVAPDPCSHYLRGDNLTPRLTSLNPDRKAHGVVECIPLELA